MLGIPDEAVELAQQAGRRMVSELRDLADDRRQEVLDDPVYWYYFETALLAQMKPARRRVAWVHKRRQRNAWAAIQADKALARICPA